MKNHLFGKKLKELRKQAGLTQHQLAEKTGLHITTIANYEIDRREPKANQVKILAKALGADIEELLRTQADGSRRSARKYLVAEASLEISGKELPSLVINLTSEGIGIYTEGKLKLHARVMVKLKILQNGSLTVTEEIPARVVWTKLIEKRYAAGLRFGKIIDKKDYPVLASCLKYAALY